MFLDVWRSVPAQLSKLRHTRINGGAGTKGAAPAVIHAVTEGGCVVYATVGKREPAAQAALVAAGFAATALTVEYADANDTTLLLYSKAVAKGEQLTVSQQGSGWYGVQLVF